MAEAQTESAAPAPAKKKRGLPIFLVVLLLLAAGGGAAYKFLILDAVPAEEGEPAPAEPVYVKLSKPFVVNLADADAQRFLQVEVNLMTRNAEVPLLIEAHAPAIEHVVVLILSENSFADLRAPMGKQKALEALRTAINEILFERAQLESAVEEVYFPSFVMQ